MNFNVHNINSCYEKLAYEEEYSSFVTYNDTCCVVDALHGYPYSEKQVNTRCPDIKEVIGTNMWHPSNIGYYQIADADYRCIINILNNI